MILSHKYQFVCLNPPKTGTGFREKLLKNYSDISVKTLDGEKLKLRHWSSTQASDYIKSINKDPNDYYWFTFVRNPWERLISWINMQQNHTLKKETYIRETTQDYNSRITEIINKNQFKDYIYRDGKLIDFIGSIENITEDLGLVLNKLNIDIPIGSREDKYKKDFKDDIRDNMSQEVIEMIADVEKDVIKLNKYKYTSNNFTI